MNLSLPNISQNTGISYDRLKNLMAGRTQMTLKERDLICKEIGITPSEVISKREDVRLSPDGTKAIDVSWMPERARKLLVEVNDILKSEYEGARSRKKESRKKPC